MAKVPGSGARRAALKMLDVVLRRGETLEQAGGAANGLPSFADRALARAIAGEVLRWLVDLDALIDSATREKLPEDAKARMVLRMMLAQVLRLETPPHAVVATALPLLAGGPKRLAHGVFATLTRQGVELPAVPSLPPKVAQRWGERAEAIAAGITGPPPLDLRLKAPDLTEEMAVRMQATSLAPGHLRLPRGASVTDLPGYEEGSWWVQDLAASIPATLLGAGEGPNGQRRVLDLAAAPGGKTLQLASAGWDVTALDINARRMVRLRENLARTGLSAHTVVADALEWEPSEPFDAILLDAPCTATGTCRRHPEVVHRIGERQIAGMVEIQRAMIRRAVQWLEPGGVFVYAVCSLEQEEGEEQARWIDSECGLRPLPVSSKDIPPGIEPTPEGWVRTDPGMLPEEGGLDGFFIGRWQRPPAGNG
ncbi:RsmB/NOP family class I SAM-dependent RNA methyltransferase [Aurantiacibacter poecillastricola]|uniref:RsmB/NOP family class I SAM-dependent RNA methyltransferase n=1 Tax=Aurantiacibacter poecillastricola TaxID=3064385 RepID=UPI00273EF70B|nr:methyltransferase domain-containing protein [Aurantiacibacter sp. 219JJ12-13]MDP5260124.1 methyltransferase domain-containing protein [Aurantiacibacter sp. 219JJ12-13]